jgi:hypothetical protein
MALALGFTSPKDLLGKAERDLSNFESAVAAQDERRIGDVLYDFSVSVTSIKDWLKAHPSGSFTGAEVEALVSASTALSSFRDIANANKHRFITHYSPSTVDATLSVLPSYSIAPIPSVGGPKRRFRVKIIRVDGTRLEACKLARTAVEEWRAFMAKHGV